MAEPAQNIAGGRFTKSEFSHSSGKGIIIDNTVVSSTTDKRDILHHVGDSVTEKQALREAMVTDAVNGPSYLSGNLSDKETNLMLEWLNSTTNHTFPDSPDTGLNFTDLLDCDMLNDSFCLFPNISSSNATNAPPHGPGEFAFWSLLLLIFPLFTVFGNVLVVLSIYRERTLRHVTNYFICSLAIADIMVAVVVMPPAVYLEVSPFLSLTHLVACVPFYFMFAFLHIKSLLKNYLL